MRCVVQDVREMHLLFYTLRNNEVFVCQLQNNSETCRNSNISGRSLSAAKINVTKRRPVLGKAEIG